ncbi:DEAD/DEAH box helicase [Inconstantimicrobium mannanitabidum]|uniref:ATP-binding protein n=1 Tax=Inconstantimicrobium mannanitabidum TaxID=1604901 RepID=A0ACB5R9J4_9CLOT|nr:AAA domain-containing protein [Clostridium sp. TW13]GKX65857.1 ATP-binding protein [Clostridium sp. TW13]
MQEITNKLYYWYTVEKFSEFKVEFDKNSYCEELPWLNNRKDKNYEVYLGIYKNSDLIDFIINKYGDKEGLPEKVLGFSCLCIFKVNENGEYIEESIKIPTLHYAINELISGYINTTNSSNEFRNFVEGIESVAINELKSVNYETLNKFFVKILKHFKWFHESWLPVGRKFKVEEIAIKNNSDNEETDTYLNSFYLKDIEKLINEVKANNYGKAFKDFVLQHNDSKKIDIENDIKHIEFILQPKNIPMGKWPSKNGLSLMQQVAVNTVLKELADSRGVFSVNGPPGTGKTTLLRDIISNIIVNRARELAKYKNPEDAFQKSQCCIKVKSNKGDDIPFHPYKLNENLKGYGITIVSSNNNAVENISKELPEIGAIKDFYNEVGADYFRDFSNKVLNIESWGLIAATLGKKANCSKFVNDFWWGGFYKIHKNEDEKNKVQSWEAEKKRFLNKYNEVESYINQLDKFKQALEEEKEVNINISEINNIIKEVQVCIKPNEEDYKRVEKINIKLKESINILEEIIKCHLNEKPSFFSRILNRKKYKDYVLELEANNQDKKKLLVEVLENNNNLNDIKEIVDKFKAQETELNEELKKNLIKLDVINKTKDEWLEKIGELYPEKYWEKSEDNQQIYCLWITEELNDKRCELFLLALQLHKTFILNAEKPIKNNMGLVMNYLSGAEIQGDYLGYMSELWNTLYLVVPVISSPFASISRMYKHLGREEIGWLLIDEAGQALPQTALGAIWRSKRVVVVGDPLQVEPVSTVPLSLIEVIGKAWNVEDVVSKTLSVQGMADNINKYGTNREELWIGCPLRVHRRCENPMFNISNEIAYENKMIYGTLSKYKELPIQKSMWIDCKGISSGGKSHYVPEQGEITYEKIKECIVDSTLPNLYVISPFTTVVNGLKVRIRELKNEFDFIDSQYLEKWIKKSIGTVHTFQGKEADIVIICLGVDKEHEGAVNWASKSPNILNVAVTRAKKRVVIIGDKELWGNKPYFKEVLNVLS